MAATPAHCDSLPQRISIELNPAYNIVSHYALRGSMTDGDVLESALSLHAEYAFSFREDSPLGKLYPTAYQGIGIAAFTLYHHDLIGTPLAIYMLQGARLADLSDKLSLGYEWRFGLSWGWHPNEAMNSRCNVVVGVALPLTWHITPKWELSLTPNFAHISNGDTSFSNSGANTFGLLFGATRLFNPEKANTQQPPYLAPSAEHQSRSFAQRLTYDMVLYGGWRADRFMQDGMFIYIDRALPIGGIQLTPLYHLNNYFAIGPSLDIQIDSSLNLFDATKDEQSGEMSFKRPPLWQQTEVGVSLRGEISAPIFSIGVGFGVNLFKHGYDMSRIYTQFVLKAHIHEPLFLFAGYRFNAVQYTHNLMFGLGIRL